MSTAGLKALSIPTMVLACKVDLEKRIESEDAARILEKYAKIVEISQYSDEGKSRMRKAVDVLVRQTSVPVLSIQTEIQAVVAASTSPTSLPSQSTVLSMHRSPSHPTLSTSPTSTLARDTSSMKSASRARSLNDLLSEPKLLLPSAAYDSEKENMGRMLSDTTSRSTDSLSDARQQSITPRASEQQFSESKIPAIPKKES